MPGYVDRRPARERVVAAPASGVRLVEKDAPPSRRGWRGLRGAVEQEFRALGRVWREDEMQSARDEWRCA